MKKLTFLFLALCSIPFFAQARYLDAVVSMEAYTTSNQIEGGRTCKGIIVSNNQILSVAYCLGDSHIVKISNSNIEQYVEVKKSLLSNGLTLIQMTAPFAGFSYQPLSITVNDRGTFDPETKVKFCGSAYATDLNPPLSDGGKPMLDQNNNVVGILYSQSTHPVNTNQKLLHYACITSEIANAIGAESK